MRVARNGRQFTMEEMRRLAELLDQQREIVRAIVQILNRRVLVKWLSTCGRANKYFEQLRSALDDDWYGTTDERSPFYGKSSSGEQRQ